ncbi:MAG: trypsin-like peptidase domain-containing protein [Candidatus Marinimicrobia bacterium]|nr:trypsin-like peptidase domain-containing protein [Candidatus Neomarinimicrobiota bacterium]
MKKNIISIIALIVSVILLIVSLQFYLDTRRHMLIDSIQAIDSTYSYQSTPQERDQINENLRTERETAITGTIFNTSSAITGIHVTRIKQYTSNPFFSDPFFSRFFPNNVYKKRIQSLGSGVLISSDGYIVTNAHVLGENAVEVYATLMGGARYPAEVIGTDALTDIALLKIDAENLPYIKMGNSDEIIIGEWVIALGNPFGLFSVSNKPIVTAGIISSIHMDFGETESGHVYQDMIQTDASINSGNSGGALVNMSGELIGINTFIFNSSTGGSGSIGIGFAIPINRVQQIVYDLKNHGQIARNWDFGISGQPLTQSIIDYYNLDTDHGIIIIDIHEGKAGEIAGLQIGDIILSVNNQTVMRNQDVINIINNSYLKVGDSIIALINRDGTEFSVQIDLIQ